MPQKLYLVFSRPPDRISNEEYLRWYDLHARENIVSPGFLSAQRFSVTAARDNATPLTHLALYEYEGEMDTWRQDLERRIDEKDIDLPEWFGEITFESWDCSPLTERIEPVRGATP
jgi:tRNA A37 threonylcarbamoyladenosine biosynthesis protein TsaE